MTAESEGESGREQRLAKLRLLYEERRLLARAIVVGVLAGTLLAFLIPEQYRSTTRLMPSVSEVGSRGALWAGLAGLKTGGSLFIGVLGSRTVADQIVQRLDLKRVYGVRSEEEALEKLAEKTDIGEDPKSGVITVTVTDHEPKRAAEIAGGYLDGLNSVMLTLNTSSAHRERMFLEERLSSARQVLETAEKTFGAFSNKTGVIDITEQDRSMVEATVRLKGQMNTAESDLAAMRPVYSDGNAQVRDVRARIAELGRQLEKLRGKSAPAIGETDDVKDSASPSLRQLPVLGVPYADLDRRVRTDEEIVETLAKEYESAKLQEAREVPTVQVLDPPEVPEKKSFPSRLWIILAGTAGISAIGALWILGGTYWNAIDSGHPGKALAVEVFHTFRRPFPKMMQGTTESGPPERLKCKPDRALETRG